MEGDNRGGIGPGFFDGRILVAIEGWGCDLSVRLSSEGMPPEYRFQGGLDVVRTLRIDGRVVAPKELREQRMDVCLSPFGPEMRFGPDDMDEVGQLHFRRGSAGKPRISSTLLIPDSTLPLVATCLNSTWKYLHVWTFDNEAERASISAFGFDERIHENLAEWVGES